MLYYAGIGSRKTPLNFQSVMNRAGLYFARKGYTLRSGGADGADSAFEAGCDLVCGPKEISLPWEHFNRNKSSLIMPQCIPIEVADIVQDIYTRYENASLATARLLARNVWQILGQDLSTPVEFVLCYTDRAPSDTGGTMFGVHLAKKHDIPVYNLYQTEGMYAFKQKYPTIVDGVL